MRFLRLVTEDDSLKREVCYWARCVPTVGCVCSGSLYFDHGLETSQALRPDGKNAISDGCSRLLELRDAPLASCLS
jgi:hypothetical protein